MESDSENEKFVALIEEYNIILDKSQNPAVKEAKQVAIDALIVKWTDISGKTLTQKSILKKLSNLKNRTKAADGKKQPLCRWQLKLLDITKVRKICLIASPTFLFMCFKVRKILNSQIMVSKNFCFDVLDSVIFFVDLFSSELKWLTGYRQR